jgi:Putative porin
MRKAIQSLVILGSLLVGSAAYAQDTAEIQKAVDGLSDVFAKDVALRWKWKGDFRVRNENIEQELSPDRNRSRMRVRLGFEAEVNPTVKAGFQFATTENGDARSTNQTFGDVNSKKALDLDLAYVEWAPNAATKVTLGKMKQPLVTTTSYFVDKDINPEGAALAFNHLATGGFVNVAMFDLAERSTAADSTALAWQAGLRGKLNDETSYVLAVGEMNHHNVKNLAVVQSGSAGGFFGNTTKTVGCVGVATCLANEFEVRNALAEVTTVFADQPVVLFVDWAENTKAAKLNKAIAYGVTLGKASLPNSWEVGVVLQKVEKDALFGQWIDSDYAAGNTDGDGYTLRGAYQLAKNWKLNVAYHMNETNNDVPVIVAVSSTAFRQVYDRDYKRLQLDLNYAF